MNIEKAQPMLLLLGALLLVATGCQVPLTDSGQYLACTPDLECRDGFVCRSVGGNAGCVPEEDKDKFDPIDDGHDTGIQDAGQDSGPEDVDEVIDPTDAEDSNDSENPDTEDAGNQDAELTTCERASVQIEGLGLPASTVRLEDNLAEAFIQVDAPSPLEIMPSGNLPADADLTLDVTKRPVKMVENSFDLRGNDSNRIEFSPTVVGLYEANIVYSEAGVTCRRGLDFLISPPSDALYVELAWGFDGMGENEPIELYLKHESQQWTTDRRVSDWQASGPTDWQDSIWGSPPVLWMNESPPGPISFLINNDGTSSNTSFDLAVNFEDAEPETVNGQVAVYLPTGEQFEVPFSQAPPPGDPPFFIIGQVERLPSGFEFIREAQWTQVPGEL